MVAEKVKAAKKHRKAQNSAGIKVISNEIAFANVRQHDLCPLQWGYFALKCRGLKKKGNSLESV